MNTNEKRFDLIDKATDVGALAMVKATNELGKLMSTRHGKYALAVPAALATVGMGAIAFAEEGGGSGDAQGMIDGILAILKPGVIAMGSLVGVVGGIQLGVSFQNENPDGKTRGFQTLIGGAIIAGVGMLVPTSISLGASSGAAYMIPVLLPNLF